MYAFTNNIDIYIYIDKYLIKILITQYTLIKIYNIQKYSFVS